MDQSGREIDPSVLSVARQVGFRAVAYAEKLLGDPALAVTLFEKAAASVSEAVEVKRVAGAPPVRDLSAYLFRTFIHMVMQIHQKKNSLEEPLTCKVEKRIVGSNRAGMESAVLLNELLSTCDRLTQDIAYRRLEGFSWKEIGRQFGMSAHAAELRFSKAIEQARGTLGLKRRKR